MMRDGVYVEEPTPLPWYNSGPSAEHANWFKIATGTKLIALVRDFDDANFIIDAVMAYKCTASS